MYTTLVSSVVELCASPVATGSVVADLVVGLLTDPVGKRAILLDSLGIAYLLAERLDGSHFLLSSFNYK